MVPNNFFGNGSSIAYPTVIPLFGGANQESRENEKQNFGHESNKVVGDGKITHQEVSNES